MARTPYLAAIAIAAVATTSAADQVFTMSGIELKLRDDMTWTCKGPACAETFKEDGSLDLNDGRTVVLQMDSTWHVMAKGELIGTKDIKITTASATATSTSPRVDAAEAQALKDFWPRMSQKLITGAPKRKLTHAKVRTCMNDLRLLPDIARTRNDKTGQWTVTSSLTIDRNQILSIVKCSATYVEETADTTTAK